MLKVIYACLFGLVFCDLSQRNGASSTNQCTLQVSSTNCTDSTGGDCCNHGFCCKEAGEGENKNVCNESAVCCPSHLHCYPYNDNRTTAGDVAKYFAFVVPVIILFVYACNYKRFFKKRRVNLPRTVVQNQNYQTTQIPQVNAGSNFVENSNYPAYPQGPTRYNSLPQPTVFGVSNSGYTYSNAQYPR